MIKRKKNFMRGLIFSWSHARMKASSNEPLFVASLPLSLKSSTSFRLSPISSVLATHLHVVKINTHTKNKMESQRFLNCLLFQLCAENHKVDIMQFPAHKLHGWFFSSFQQILLLFCMFALMQKTLILLDKQHCLFSKLCAKKPNYSFILENV